MSCIRGLELLFNLERKNIKSREDCIVTVFHCLMINEGLQCVGTGDDWPHRSSWTSTELLPQGWNDNQDLYSLRYSTEDGRSRFLLKIAKSGHILLINVAKNEDAVASFDVPTSDYVSDNYSEYSTAFKDLGRLAEFFAREIMDMLKGMTVLSPEVNMVDDEHSPQLYPEDVDERRAEPDLEEQRYIPPPNSPYPRIGGSDLDPLGGGRGGGMLLDPSGLGIPARPTLPEFGVGIPGGLPRGAVPPGARFDPIRPPIHPRRKPDPNRNPDEFNPPDD